MIKTADGTDPNGECKIQYLVMTDNAHLLEPSPVRITRMAHILRTQLHIRLIVPQKHLLKRTQKHRVGKAQVVQSNHVRHLATSYRIARVFECGRNILPLDRHARRRPPSVDEGLHTQQRLALCLGQILMYEGIRHCDLLGRRRRRRCRVVSLGERFGIVVVFGFVFGFLFRPLRFFLLQLF